MSWWFWWFQMGNVFAKFWNGMGLDGTALGCSVTAVLCTLVWRSDWRPWSLAYGMGCVSWEHVLGALAWITGR